MNSIITDTLHLSPTYPLRAMWHIRPLTPFNNALTLLYTGSYKHPSIIFDEWNHIEQIETLWERCSAWGILSLKLGNYRNPDSTLFNGECCDTPAWCTYNECENYFKFCVTSLGSLRTCNLGSSTTKVLGDDDFSFPGVGHSLGTNLINPLTYNFSYWQGSTVVVEVWDDDGGHIVGALHDFVDKYTLTLSQLQPADPDSKSSTPQTKKLCGKRSCMAITVTLYCGPNYLVPDCSTYCVSHNDSLGHYHCNYTVGRKICNEGWYDPLTDCVKKRKFCTPRNDSLGHYNCDPASGEKLCLAGWTGDNCSQVCVFSRCLSNVLKSTPKHIPESSSLNFVALTTTVISTTITYLDTGTASTKNNYLSSNHFTARRSSVLHHVTSFPSSSVSRILSVTEDYTLPLNTILPSSQSYQTPTLQSLVSTKLPSSSSLTSYSSSLMMSSLSSLPKTPRFQTSAHVSLLSLTLSVTRLVEKSSVVPSPTPVRPTDGIEIELKPNHEWTLGREKQVVTELVNKLNEYCAKHPMPCLMTPNITVNRTILNLSHVIMKTTNSSNGKIWVRVKVKLPATVPHVPGIGYLPSVVLKRIVLENEDRLEKSLEAEIVTVKEVAWDLPTPPPEQSTLMMVTDIPTTLQEYYAGFLPYVLVALCLTAAFIVGFAFYRRSKLRQARVLPEPESNKSEEELISLSSRKSSTNTRPRSAPDDTKSTGNHQSDFNSFHDNPDASRRNKYRFRSESGLRELIASDSKSSEDEDTNDGSRSNNLFLTKSRLRELTQVST